MLNAKACKQTYYGVRLWLAFRATWGLTSYFRNPSAPDKLALLCAMHVIRY